ncbi:MAG: ABC transporter ATP-binding protein, partial [Phycisphaerae bacterium]
MATVELENVSKIYADGTPAVNSISLAIRDHEFIVLVGPSGCGKTTTLRMIAGLEGISSGQLKINGRVVNDVAPKDRDIAMVFQNYALYPHMSVYKNMAFSLEMRRRDLGLTRAMIDQRVREVAKSLGL